MGDLVYEGPKISGKLIIDSTKFPTEILEDMMRHPGNIPMFRIELPKIYMTDGVAITSSYVGTTIELEFAAGDIKIEVV